MSIPLVDLRAQYRSIQTELDEAVGRVMSSAAFIMGPELNAFEADFAEYARTKHAIGVGSGTDALLLAMQAAGIGPGDEVITTPHTFIATVEPILQLGARPVFVDIDPVSYNIDSTLIEAAITPKTKAIVPVHLYGQPADMTAISVVANKHNLLIIEDAAQAHGAEWDGQRVGSWGAATGFSFYPGKNLGAAGDAGGIITNNDEIAQTIRLLLNHGSESKYVHVLSGYNARMDGIQAAVLTVKLKHIEAWTEARRQHAAAYDAALADIPGIVTPKADARARHVYHLYVIRVPGDRDAFISHLHEKGIGAGIHYPIPLHLQPAFSELGFEKGSFPVAEAVASSIISLPLFPELIPEQIEQVVDAVRSATKVAV